MKNRYDYDKYGVAKATIENRYNVGQIYSIAPSVSFPYIELGTVMVERICRHREVQDRQEVLTFVNSYQINPDPSDIWFFFRYTEDKENIYALPFDIFVDHTSRA